MKDSALKGTLYRGIAKTTQGNIELLESLKEKGDVYTGIGKIIAVYPEAMTCDIETQNGSLCSNVPLLSKCGLEDDEVWGELELPSVDSYVVIGFVENRSSFPFILGTFYPYSNSKYGSGQVPVNSSSKQFTKKLLEKIDPKVYRKIYKSGTTIEVQEDGTLILETPDGTYFQIDATSGLFKIEDSNGNIIESTSSSVKINGNLEVLQ